MKDSVAIKREVVSRGAGGDAEKVWTEAARGSDLPTSMACRIQSDKPEEAIGLGVRADRRLWRIYFSDDPFIDTRDRVFIPETGHSECECIVIEPSFQWDNQQRLWRCRVQQYIATLD